MLVVTVLLLSVTVVPDISGFVALATDRIELDQIEASKLVQRALFRRWSADPRSRPVRRPDLRTEVRPRLDRLTVDMLEAIKAAERARALPSCERKLTWAAFRVSARRDLDRPHRAGLHRALGSFCEGQLVSW
ncbi:hypothetical protein [Nonomuraea endophytica]|uniref:hypothetical protein n=1 Tax=Nonomuraea endophytica TaxID=714136 RepID=UPI0037C6F4E7